MGVTREVLKQLCTVPIVDIDSKLDWLYEVWPRLACRVVRDSGWLPLQHREAVRRWGEHNLWPGHDGTEPPGGSAGGNGAAGSGGWQWNGAAGSGTERHAAAVGSGNAALDP